MAKKTTVYKIKEAGGFVFNGTIYSEHSEHDLKDWPKSDIQAALASRMIEKIEVITTEVESDGKS